MSEERKQKRRTTEVPQTILGEFFFNSSIQKILKKNRKSDDPSWPLCCFQICDDVASGTVPEVYPENAGKFFEYYRNEPFFILELLKRLQEFHDERNERGRPSDDEALAIAANQGELDGNPEYERSFFAVAGNNFPSHLSNDLLRYRDVAETFNLMTNRVERIKDENSERKARRAGKKSSLSTVRIGEI